MKREDVRQIYDDSTSTLSEVIRKHALAGIAALWLVRTGDTKGIVVYDRALQFSLALFVMALSLDLLQYAYKSAAWGIYNRRKECQDTPADQEFQAPAQINWPTLFFFWFKVGLTAAGYIIFLCVLGRQLLGG